VHAHEVFLQSNGTVTLEYYDRLRSIGPHGELAVALMRALKRSKKPSGFGFRRISKRKTERYDNAEHYEWAIRELIRILMTHAAVISYRWGWLEGWLYIELPSGQVRLLSENRGLAQDYGADKVWDGGNSDLRIVQFCDAVDAIVPTVLQRKRIVKAQPPKEIHPS